MVDKLAYRGAMAKLCAAVNVVTTYGDSGLGGFTASAVCSVTDEPPTLLVCMNRNSQQNKTFRENGALCVNVLSGECENISDIFAGRAGLSIEDRFEHVNYTSGVTKSPVLNEAAVSFDCIIENSVTLGTHDVLFCRVLEIYNGKGRNSLIYLNKCYQTV